MLLKKKEKKEEEEKKLYKNKMRSNRNCTCCKVLCSSSRCFLFCFKLISLILEEPEQISGLSWLVVCLNFLTILAAARQALFYYIDMFIYIRTKAKKNKFIHLLLYKYSTSYLYGSFCYSFYLKLSSRLIFATSVCCL